MSVDIIPDFVKYQIEWLTSHDDLKFEPVIEDAIVKMLKDAGKSFIDEQAVETSQFDHIAESDRKVSISCAHENDVIFRQAAIEAMGKAKWAKERLEELPSAQPDRKLIDDYMWKIKQNISPHTAAEGVIAIKYYLEQIYEQIYREGEKPKWMT